MKAHIFLALAPVFGLIGGCGGGNDAVTTTPTAHLAITPLAGPASVSVGTPYAFTVSALDASNAVVTTYAGTVHITSSDSSAMLPPDAILLRGTGTFCVTFGASNTSQTVTASDIAVDATPVTSAPVSVTAAWSWSWISGANTINAQGVYGTKGVPAVGNVPGARSYSVSWIDGAGDLWLFGGSTGITDLYYYNDLWRYSPGSGLWTWVSGANTSAAQGVYATKGVPATGNVPGARSESVSWIDNAGNLWLFGGYGYDSTGGLTGFLNDLWRYSPGSGLWTWVSGANTSDAQDVYGRKGVAAAGNVPGARVASVSWIDNAGNLWLFGGYGYDSTGFETTLNDLWRYSPGSGLWTWVSGANTVDRLNGDPGVYGTKGVAAADNVPGGRESSVSWIDNAGELWLFGGGYPFLGSVNDLWRYSPGSGLWTWISGSNTDAGMYGTKGVAATNNVPAGRFWPASWVDRAGKLWLFGGYGPDGPLNDLWCYSPEAGLWAWISGANTVDAQGMYGTKDVTAADNAPGARVGSVSWIDSSGNLWLFGGEIYEPGGGGRGFRGDLNDLWRYGPGSGT